MSLLDQQLSSVAFRFRQLAWWRSSAIFCVLLALTGLVLLWLQVTARWMHAYSGWWLLGGGLLGLVAIAGMILSHYRDHLWLAYRIEEHYPELDQRLLTTLDEIKRSQGQSLSYLQHTVLQETMTHSYHNPWSRIVSPRLMSLFRSRSLVAFALMMASAIGLMKWQPPASAFVVKTEAVEEELEQPADFDIKVDPGDWELERGTNLVVMARFGKHVPKEATMVASDGSTELRIPMSRSLDDPLFGGTLSDVQSDLEYHVVYGRRKSPSYRVTVYTVPGLVRADALLEYPGYTQMGEKRIEDTRRVSAVQGSRVTWEIHVNKPNVKAELVPREGGEAIPLQLDPSDGFHHLASLDLEQTTSWTLKLVDQDGRENRNPPRLMAKVIANRAPNLKLEVARDVRASPLEELQVKATVSDDFGLSKYGISYTLASSPPKEVVLGQNTARRDKREAEYLLDLESMDAEPDQLLSYYFWAEDHDAMGAPRRTQSDMYFAEVRHFEEIFRQGQQQAGGQQQQQQQQQGQQSPNAQTAEQLAELQKQILNATWNVIRRETKPELSPEFEGDVATLVESQQAGSQQLQELAQKVRDSESQQHLLDVQKHVQTSIQELTSAYADQSVAPLTTALEAQRAAYQALLKLRAREHEVVQNQQQSGSPSGSPSGSQRFQQQLQQLQLENDQNRYETERQAQQEEDAGQTEMRQALSRLRELAQRQEDLNQQLKELQNALEQAETEEEREEIQRQLKRLREQQQEMLRDTDELMEQLDQAQNQESLQQTREQLEQTREQLRDSAESLQRGAVTPALASGTRAQRELEEMREELRRESANQFSEQMREMRDKAQALEAKQEEIGQQLEQLDEESNQGAGLRDEDMANSEDVEQALQEQQERLNELLQEIEQTVLEAEDTERLLADRLYDAFREIEDDNVVENLEQTRRMMDRGLSELARDSESQAREGISKLRQQIDRAAESVLGDELEELRTAVRMLEDVERQLDQEIEQFDESRDRSGEPRDGEAAEAPERAEEASAEQGNEQGSQNSDSTRQQPNEDAEQDRRPNSPGNEAQERSETDPSGQPSDPNQDQQDRPTAQSPGQAGPSNSEQQNQDSQGQQPGSSQAEDPQQRDQNQGAGNRRDNSRPQRDTRLSPNDLTQEDGGGGWGGWERLDVAPITGDDFRQWSDRMRDVEEIVRDPELRAEAARIRERARSFRREFKRHSEKPKWDLIREMVARPLRELRQEVSAELLRRSATKMSLVPIDRDPVPEQFSEQVRQYREKIGRGE